MFETSSETMLCSNVEPIETSAPNKNISKHILNFKKNNLFSIDIHELIKKIEDTKLVSKYYSRISLSCCIVPDWYEYTNFVLVEYILSKLFGDKYEEETTDMFIIKSNKRKKGIISKSLSFGKHYKMLKNNNLMIVTVDFKKENNKDDIEVDKYLKEINVYGEETIEIRPIKNELIYTIEVVGVDSKKYTDKILNFIKNNYATMREKSMKNTIRFFECNIHEFHGRCESFQYMITSNMVNHIRYPMLKDVLNKLISFDINRNELKKIGCKSKFGVLLYGPPGTGKSTFAKYLAYKLKRNLYNVNLVLDDTKELEFSRPGGFYDLPNNSVLLIDELDLIVQNNYGSNMHLRDASNNKRVQGLIKFIDSVSDGNIVIATTNNIDIIDERLKRPGRFDIIVELKPVKSDECDYILSTYDDIDKDVVKKTIMERYPNEISMAELSDVIIDYKLKELGFNKTSESELMEDYDK